MSVAFVQRNTQVNDRDGNNRVESKEKRHNFDSDGENTRYINTWHSAIY